MAFNIVGQLISMVLGSVLNNSGDKGNQNGLINEIVSKAIKNQKKVDDKPKPLLSGFDDTNSIKRM